MAESETPEVAPRFGALLRRYRLAAGLTQEALAERAGLGVRAISDFERETSRRPRHDTVDLLATTLRLSAQERTLFASVARGQAVWPAPAVAPQASRPVLVGRARELEAVRHHLAGDGPPVLLLAGPPGIGKSRLLHEAARHGAEGGWTVLAGGCQWQGGPDPFAPLVGALQQYMLGQSPVHLRADLEGCAWLIRLLPELADGPIEPLPPWIVAPAQERRLMVQALARFLANVAGRAGTLLVLDDLQWAGPDALAVLTALLRTPGARTLRVVGAYRDTEVAESSDLALLLSDLAHAGLATHRTVPPLSEEEAGQLLDSLWGDGSAHDLVVRSRLLQRAGGLPFFLVSCAQAAGQDGTASGEVQVPWDVAHSVRQRVGALPEESRTALWAAAVIGRVVSVPWLAGTLACPTEQVVAALDAACRAGLVQEEGSDTYVFAHDLIREVIEEAVGAPRRALLHQRIAEVLERQPEPCPVALLAYHVARSPQRERALVYLERAGDEAHAGGAHAAAEGYYRQLLTEVERAGETAGRARVREKLGTALTALARYAEALGLLDEAVALYETLQDREAQALALARVASLLALTWAPEAGLPRLQAIIDELEAAGPSPGLAAAYHALSKLYLFAARYREQVIAAERAAALAGAVGDERLLAEVDLHYGLALHMTDHDPEARALLERAVRRAERVGSDLVTLCLALTVLGCACEDEGAFALATQYVERAQAVAERQGDVALQAYALTRRGTCAFHRGDWDQARRDCTQAVALGRPLETSWLARYPLLDLGRICLRAGDWDAAERYLEEFWAHAEPGADLQAVRDVQGLFAELELRRGRPAKACARLLPLRDRPGMTEPDVTLLVLPTLTWAHLERGDVDQAVAMAAEAAERARKQRYRPTLASVLCLQARAAMRHGRWAEADRALGEGLRLAQGLPAPYAEACLLDARAEWHVARGTAALAERPAQEALAIFRRLGASKDVERMEQWCIALPELHHGA